MTKHPTAAPPSPPKAEPVPVAPDRSLTFGERAVGLGFNPSGDAAVHSMKVMFAQIIDDLDHVRAAERAKGSNDHNERLRLAGVAITEAQAAQMWAVKALTGRDEPSAPAA